MPKIATKLRQRTEKINSEQKKIVLQFIACTPEIINTTVTPEFSLQHHQQFWQNLTNVLNLFGPPRKPAESWKKVTVFLNFHVLPRYVSEFNNNIIIIIFCRHGRIIDVDFAKITSI